jgi:hypothetical protein
MPKLYSGVAFDDPSGISFIDRILGALSVSNDGGVTWAPVGSGTFGPNTQLKQPNGSGITVNSGRLQNDFVVNTAGAEISRWRIFGVLNGSSNEVELGGFEFLSGTFSAFYLGAVANNNYLRQTSAGTWDMSAAGSAVLGMSNTLVTALNGFQVNGKFQETSSGAVAVATTITWGVNNTQPVTVGTGTLNSINMGANGWAAGFRGSLVVPSGVTITHGVAGTGATILTPTGASIVTTTKRSFACSYDGTNLIIEG